MSDPASLEDIFADALALTGAERTAFLDRACGGDAALRANLDGLLRASDRAGRFLDGEKSSPAPGEEIGSRIDRYKLLEKIGEGGCGVVYRAEQESPVR